MKKYYSAFLILVAMLVAIAYFQRNAAISNVPNLRNEAAIEHLKQTGGFDSLNKAFQAARYEIAAFSAENPANGLRAQFSESGDVRLFGTKENWQTAFRLKSFGRGSEQTTVSGGSWQENGSRAELRRTEIGLTEYFENRPDGLEQGFILDAKPSGNENLSLILQTSGELNATASADGQKIVLSDASGAEVLHYDKLKVWDAENKYLTARMMTDNTGEIRLEVEDATAVYPLTIDPTFIRTTKLTANDGGASDRFGSGVAISGETVIVGAEGDDIGGNSDQGSAYIFVRNGVNWIQQAKLTANDGATSDHFGSGVAISGETVIIGASSDDIGGNSDQGSAYIFVRNGVNWIQQAKLTANDGAASDRFGSGVAISGETVIVGAYTDDIGGNSDQGSAYIFVRNGVNWTQQAKLTANDGSANDYFGSRVAISGETVVVSASSDDIGGNSDQGSAYIFTRNGTNWTLQQKLTANDGATDDFFGSGVAISGETVIIGASSDDIGGNSEQGSAYIFVRNGVNWIQQAKLTANDGATIDRFGSGVAISGETVIIGASSDDIGGNSDQGSAYIFVRNGVNWIQQAKLTANDGATGDLFGSEVAISGQTVIVGARLANIGGHLDQGSAYVYHVVGGVWQSEQQLASDGAASDQFGYSVAVSNNTAVVGAPFDDTGAVTEQGAAYVFVRNSGGGWTQQAKLLSPDPGGNEKFGASVAISGDRIIVGTPEDNNGINLDQGAAYIFVRSGTNWIPEQKLTASDGASGDEFGISVSISGNRVIVGAHLDNVGANTDQGAAYIFLLSGSTWTQEAKLTAADGAADDFFGRSVGISFDTAIVGAYGSDTSTSIDRGAAYIYRGESGNWTQQDKLQNSSEGDRQGYSVAISGDTVAVGSPRRDVNSATDIGRVYVYIRGTGTNWVSQTSFSPADGEASDQFGYSVAIDGELIAVGSPFSNPNGISNQGAVYVFIRNGTAWTQLTKLVANDGATTDQNGFSVAIDGSTAVTGANFDNVGANSNQGSAYFFEALPKGQNTPFDFDGDGKTDLGIFRPAPGEWWINRSSTGATFAAQFGLSTDRITPADFTGDGQADIAFFRPSNGQWFVLRSEDSTFYAFPFGANGDTPVPADYDGDGKADAAVFRESSLTWYISKSSGGTDIIGFGASGDKPVIGDYDGDGRGDIAIYRPSGANGAEWWIRRSSNATVFAAQFGTNSDKPVQGDYTGDGKADIAFFRPSNGTWFVLRSEDFSFYSFPFGVSGDVPVAGDYDGDGKTDAGVFRPTNNTWFVQRSTAGTLIQQFGQADDKPVPNAFVP